LQHYPLGHVGGPEDHPLAAGDAKRHQAARDRAGFLLEGGKGQPRAVAVDEGLAVRQRPRESRELATATSR
jgi:hypothetical protein